MDAIILFLQFMFNWWWVILPPILGVIFWEMWLSYIKTSYSSAVSWAMMEVSVPKEVFQTPKSVESIFASLHSMSSPPDEFMDKYWKGKIQDYLCFEIVGTSGKSHFYVRAPSALKNYISSQIYAQYPKAEINEVSDYVSSIPSTAPDPQYELWGAEMILAKEDGYPIRTYVQFEETVEEKRIDPISSLMETFTNLKDGEQIWLQILIKPTATKWEKEGEKLRDKLIGKKPKVEKLAIEKLLEKFGDLLSLMIEGGSAKSAPAKEDSSKVQNLTPGQKEVLESIEKNISKLGFDTSIRTIYIAKREMFNRANIPAIMGFFKQFNTLNLNGFKPNSEVGPKVKTLFFKKQREYLRKRALFSNYIMRVPGSKGFVFNTEELATIYHFPATVVEAPTTPRVEAKKAEPPANLPV